MTATLALFDLDHTLIPLDSDHAWSDFTFELGWADAPDFRQTNERMFEAYRSGSVDIREYVRFNTSTMRAREPAVAAAARERFMSAVIEPALRPAATALVEHHKARGHRTLIVTATNEWITEPIARRFGVDDLIAVRLARDRDRSGLAHPRPVRRPDACGRGGGVGRASAPTPHRAAWLYAVRRW
ncbi:MAG TPA: HAD family hydrolase [Rubrivivax sp.]|nr:HAD family hydrolase [Rubrivivax sp.]